MADETNNPVAQGPDAGTENAGDPSISGESNSQGNAPSGFQARISELTAHRREAERRAEEYAAKLAERDQQIAELVRSVTSRQQPEPEPDLNLDPEQKRILDVYMSRATKPLQQHIEQLTTQLGMQRAQSAAEQLTGDPEIANRAAQLMVGWQKQGYTGWTPEDAVVYAAGQAALNERKKAGQARNARSAFNSEPAVIPGHSQTVTPNPTSALPPNFDDLPVEKQLEILERRLDGKGF